MKYITTIDNREFEIEIVDEHHLRIGDRLLQVDFESVSGQPVYSLIVDGKSHEGYVAQNEDIWQVLLRGRLYPITVEDEREKRLRSAAGSGVAETGEFHLRAPMPGLVVPNFQSSATNRAPYQATIRNSATVSRSPAISSQRCVRAGILAAK